MSTVTRRRYSAPAGRVRESAATQRAAAQLGISAQVLGQEIRSRGIHIHCAALIEQATLTGDDALFARLTAPILAAIERRPVPPLTDILDRAQLVDLREDMAEQGHLLNPHDLAAVRAHLGLARQQLVTTIDLVLALEEREKELAR